MNEKDAQSSRFGHELAKREFDILTREQVQKLLEQIAAEDREQDRRDEAFQSLIHAHARLIYGKVKMYIGEGNRIGVEDRATDFFNSVVIAIDQNLTNLAQDVLTGGFSFTTAVAIRVRNKMVNKTDAANAQKRDQRRTQQLNGDKVFGREANGDSQLLLKEIEQQTRALIDTLDDDLEKQTILASYGLGDGHAMKLADVASSLEVSDKDARNAFRRAMSKLKKLSQD